MTKDSISILYDLFADLLDYPTLATSLKAGLCCEQLLSLQPEAGGLLESFYHEMEQRTLEKIQELYTTTFDMQPVCYPYIGYQLFGDSYKRGVFMARLNEAYYTSGYSAGQELPDHLSVILRFLGLDTVNRDDDFCHALLMEGLIPALGKMLQAFGSRSENPYFALLSALHLVLIQNPVKEFGHA